MKKLSLLAVAIIFAFAVNAQKIGFKVGTNLAGMTIDDISAGAMDLANIDGKLRPGLQFGLVVEKDLIPLVDLRIEALYNQKGSNQTTDNYLGTGVSVDIKTTYNYFELPILAKIKFGKIYVTAGPYLGYAISGNVESTTLGVTLNHAIDFDAEEIKKFDLGASVGLGAQFGVGPLAAFAELRGSYGFVNILNNPDYADEYQKNMGLALSVGFLIGK